MFGWSTVAVGRGQERHRGVSHSIVVVENFMPILGVYH